MEDYVTYWKDVDEELGNPFLQHLKTTTRFIAINIIYHNKHKHL